MIENFETIQIVLYLPGGYTRDLETTRHMSHVTCHMSYVTIRAFPNRKT